MSDCADCPEEGEGEQVMWQPIESAPKDGTVFIAVGYDYGIKTLGRHCAFVVYDADHNAFMDNIDGHKTFEHLTHWAPAPPQEQQ